MPDTLATNVAETTQEIIAATVALMPQTAPMMNLVTRYNIPKGHDRVEIPRMNSTFTVQTPTEGDEIVAASQYDLTSTTIQPTLRAIYVRLSGRAEYFGRDNLIAAVSKELARAQGVDIDDDLTAEFANFGNTDVGATNRNLRLADIRRAVRVLQANTAANGGPPAKPWYLVLSPMQVEMLLADAGALGAGSTAGTNTAPWIPDGLSQEILDNYFVGRWFTVPVFQDGNIDAASNVFSGAMFAKEALMLAMSKDWDMKTFEESEWIGPIIRCVADYNSGIPSFTRWGVEVVSNDTAP